MRRNVTAVYRTHGTAVRVRRALADLGIAHGRIHVIPEAFEPVGPIGMRDDARHIDDLRDLRLPDEDFCHYLSSVRRGDYVVSAEADRDVVPRVLEIMRRPEAATRTFEDAAVVDIRGGGVVDVSRRGERDPRAAIAARAYPRG